MLFITTYIKCIKEPSKFSFLKTTKIVWTIEVLRINYSKFTMLNFQNHHFMQYSKDQNHETASLYEKRIFVTNRRFMENRRIIFHTEIRAYFTYNKKCYLNIHNSKMKHFITALDTISLKFKNFGIGQYIFLTRQT